MRGTHALGALAVAAVTAATAVPAQAQQDQADVPPPVASATPVTEAQIDAAVAQLDTLAPELLQRTGVPGMAIAVVHGDQVVYAKGFGVRNTRTNQPVDANTVFQLASMSKPLGATVIARAVGQHKVAWTDKVRRYLPWFKLGNPATNAELQIADLYSHRSGLPDHAGDLLEDLGYDRTQILHRLRYLPLRPIRTHYAYTNFGMTAGAEAVAAATHTPWATLSQQELYGPLGMTHTSSRYAGYAKASNRADLHVDADGTWKPLYQRKPDAQSPAGGVSSTVTDLAQWMRLELGEGRYDGQRIIAAAALLQTFTPHIVTADVTLPAARSSFYGLGWDMSDDQTGRVRLSHSGAFALGAATTVWLVPDLDLGITVLTNGAPIGLPESLVQDFLDLAEQGHITRDWLAAYGPSFAALAGDDTRLRPRPPANAKPQRAASAYTGRYAHNPYYGPLTVTAKGQRLTLRIGAHQTAYPLTHYSGDTFAWTPPGESSTGRAAVTFAGARAGRPQRVTIENLDAEGLGTFRR
jgi:CubicO group peptidase (beta-lactamase class C family)